MELLPDVFREESVFRGLLGKRFPEEYEGDVRAVRDALWLDLLHALDGAREEGRAAAVAGVVSRSPHARRDCERERSLLWALAAQADAVADALADAADARGGRDLAIRESVSGEVRFAFRPDPPLLAFWVPEGLPHRRRVDAVPLGRIAVTSRYYRTLRDRWMAWVGYVRERATAAGVWPADLPSLVPAAVLCAMPARYRDLDNGIAKPVLEALCLNGLLPDDDPRVVPWLLVHAMRRLQKGTAVAVLGLGTDRPDPRAALTAGDQPPDLAVLLGAVETVLPPPDGPSEGSA